MYATALPLGPDDLLSVEVEPDDLPVEPVVLDAAGQPVAIEPWTVQGTHGWLPADGWAPGLYEVVGAVGREVVVPEEIAFEVGAYGLDPVDPVDLVGRTWAATDYESSWRALIEMIGEQRTAGVAIEAIAGDQVTFWLLGQVDGEWCGVLHDVGTLSADGRLDWTRAELQADADGTVVTGHDLALSIAWLADSRQAWGIASGALDTRDLGALAELGTDPEAICELGASFGWICDRCPDDLPTCMGLSAQAIALEEIEPLDPATLPLCGLDRLAVDVPTLAPISCDIEPLDLDPGLDLDCGCRTVGLQGGLPLVLVGLLAAGRRKRR
jgi:hypothetical protein